MSLAEDLAALRLNGVTVADFVDGKLTHVEIGLPAPLQFEQTDEEDKRGVMVLPGNRGGPAEVPGRQPEKPKDLFRDVILADMPSAGELTEDDLPEEPDGDDEPEPAGETTHPVETRDDLGDGGLPGSGVEQAASWRGQSR